MGFIKVGAVLFASLLVGMANASNGNKNNNNKTENKMTVTELTQEDFVKKVYDFETNPNAWKFEGDKPAVIDFYATWCGPCKMVGPVLEELDAENDQLTVVKVNVDNELDLASKYGVQSIPNMIFFKEGKAVTQIIGFANKDAILDKINPFMD